jgi:cytochrome P450
MRVVAPDDAHRVGRFAVGPELTKGDPVEARDDGARLPDYDPHVPQGGGRNFAGALNRVMPGILWYFRTFCPIPRLGAWAAVTRHDDVAEVLARHDVFGVPYSAEMARLNDGEAPGTPFILGMDDEMAHDRQQALVMQAFRREDVAKGVKDVLQGSADAFAASEQAQNGRIDAIPGLITAFALDICRDYYGISLPQDRQKFAYATIDVSGHLFGLPPIEPDAKIDVAAAYMRAVVDASIEAEMNQSAGKDTVLARLVARHGKTPEEPTRRDIRAFLIGMIVGFVPTNTMAAGKILEMLLEKEEFIKAARNAALAGDDDLLRRCLLEASRFMPINPGPFRVCSRDYTVAVGTPRAATIKAGTKMLASTQSAMMDRRRVFEPREFRPGRPASDYMLFGYGMHFCAGVFIAQAHITQALKALLVQKNLRRAAGAAGKLRWRGGFPDHLHVEFDPVQR